MSAHVGAMARWRDGTLAREGARVCAHQHIGALGRSRAACGHIGVGASGRVGVWRGRAAAFCW